MVDINMGFWGVLKPRVASSRLLWSSISSQDPKTNAGGWLVRRSASSVVPTADIGVAKGERREARGAVTPRRLGSRDREKHATEGSRWYLISTASSTTRLDALERRGRGQRGLFAVKSQPRAPLEHDSWGEVWGDPAHKESKGEGEACVYGCVVRACTLTPTEAKGCRSTARLGPWNLSKCQAGLRPPHKWRGRSTAASAGSVAGPDCLVSSAAVGEGVAIRLKIPSMSGQPVIEPTHPG